MPRKLYNMINTLLTNSLIQVLGNGHGWAMVLGNFQCRSVLPTSIIARQGPTLTAAGAAGSCLDVLSVLTPQSYLFTLGDSLI